jgi:hypothetical protein
VKIESTVEAQVPDYSESAPEYYTGDPAEVSDKAFETVLGFSIPEGDRDMSLPITPADSLELAAGTPRGDKIIALITAAVEKIGGGGINSKMMRNTAFQIPIRCFITMSGGVVNDEMCEGICDLLNNKPMGKCLVKIDGYRCYILSIECDFSDKLLVEGFLRSGLNYCANRNAYMCYCELEDVSDVLTHLGFEKTNDVYSGDIPTLLKGSCCK